MIGQRAVAAAEQMEDAAEAFLGRGFARRFELQAGRHRHGRRAQAAGALGGETVAREEVLEVARGEIEAREFIPFRPRRHGHRALQGGDLRGCHQAGVIVLMAGQGQAIALHRVGDETDRSVVVDGRESVEHGGQIMAAEIGHQIGQFGVVEPVDNRPCLGRVG